MSNTGQAVRRCLCTLIKASRLVLVSQTEGQASLAIAAGTQQRTSQLEHVAVWSDTRASTLAGSQQWVTSSNPLVACQGKSLHVGRQATSSGGWKTPIDYLFLWRHTFILPCAVPLPPPPHSSPPPSIILPASLLRAQALLSRPLINAHCFILTAWLPL